MTNLHRLTAADVDYTDHGATLLRRFNSATEDHQLTVLHDDGLYRHLSFRAPGSSFYWFDLITWPGNLTITGDMGTWTFRRVEDMFTFFTGYINSGYWAEKLQNGDTGGQATAREYDEDLFIKWLGEDFWETSRNLDQKTTTIWWKAIKDYVLDDWVDTGSANAALSAMSSMSDALNGAMAAHYADVWEAAEGWEQYTIHFEWCLAAIVTGIRTYKAHKAADPIGKMMAALTEQKDILMPTKAQVEALHKEAMERGFGLSVMKGRPGTLRLAPGAVPGELLVIDPAALA
ncbi:hypothetical protein [Glutamicibacter sp. 2E12]|uniref:hypothetical protein n=1 Tax=Glutamicibacter sp. 2E12 TaxID=3416181 RepID=UPI003CEA4551